MSMKSKYSVASVIAAVAVVATLAHLAGAEEETFRQEYSAFGVFMQGGRPETLEIVITRWTTEEERSLLVNTLANEGQEKTIALLRKQEQTGFVKLRSGRDIQGKPNVRLHYAYEFKQKDGNRQIVLVTERPMGMGESMMASQTEATVSAITMELHTDGGKETGTGVVLRAVKFGFDKDEMQLKVETITKQPIHLTKITRDK